MLKTEQLAQYLNRYKRLSLHQDQKIKESTWQISDLQKNRIFAMHPNLFENHDYQTISHFFVDYLYNFDALLSLAEQMQLIIEQKIKLDRWIPDEILDTLLLATELALLTLRLDQQLARFLIKNHMQNTESNVLIAVEKCEQYRHRMKQLKLLKNLGLKLNKLAHSILIRSTLKLAKNKMTQRGFSEIHAYLEHGFHAFRTNKQSNEFLIQLCHQEHCFLDYLVNVKPMHLHVYYDAVSQQMQNISIRD